MPHHCNVHASLRYLPSAFASHHSYRGELCKPCKRPNQISAGQHLGAIDHVPVGSHFDAAYILGSSRGSLYLKFRKAEFLYKHGLFKTILVRHRSGITEYYPKFGRNLKNDEWSIMKLTELGIPGSDIEIVNIN